MSATPRIGLALAAILPLVGCTSAEDSAAMSRGRDLAQDKCAACHAISGERPGPNKQATGFAIIARQYSRKGLTRELQAINEVGHYAMPTTPLSESDRASLAAYIFQGRAGP